MSKYKILYTITGSLILLFSFSNIFGQTVANRTVSFTLPEVVLLDIEPGGSSSISLTLTVNPESGLPVSVTSATNSTLWINYSSCIPVGGNNRTITANVSSGTIPSGINIVLSAAAYSGIGEGTFGTSSGSINLSGTPQVIVSGIGGCYTGDGINNGHLLNYSVNVSSFQNLQHNQSTTLQVAFTLTDN
jgi:hypothetical protein